MKKATLVLDRDFPIGETDPKLFSSFVEPLGRCIYGGIYEPGHPMADENGFRKDVLELTRALHLTMNRFPGGNFVSTYRWEDGIGPREKRPRRADPAWLSIETNAFGLNEFAQWSKLNGSDVMMTVNLATRGVLEAMDCVEYCNMDSGTYWSDLRASHGYRQPYGYRYWCLSNEVDGVWQVGQKHGGEYGRLAREASKGMKLLDRNIRTVLAGSSSPGMATFPSFDADALEEAYDFVDYLSVHQYIGNRNGDLQSFLARPLITEQFMKDVAAVCDYARAKAHSKKTIQISFDEFNVWHSISSEERFDQTWQIAPHLLEDRYTMADAVALGGMLIAILHNAHRIGIACISELVNCISHIRTENGGAAWALPPYYAYQLYSLYGRGVSLHTALQSDKYDCAEFTDVPFVEAAAVQNQDGTLSVFALNRSLDEAAPLSIELRGFGEYQVARHIVLQSGDPGDTNTKEDPFHVVPKNNGDAAVQDGLVQANLAPLSWNVIRLAKRQA